MDTWWSDEQIETLRFGDVMPLPLMLETNWTTEGWEVNVILVTDVGPNGYSSYNEIWSHRQPYTDGGSPDEAHRVTDDAVRAFGDRLRAVLADPTPSVPD